jgi:3-phenylpropionate/trans-cinnamate dioxygenase ferredoxin subunit
MAEFVRVASVSDVAADSAKQVVVGGRKIALVNVRGTFHAVDDTCTHEDESLSEGVVAGEIIVCPKHGSRFNVVSGRVLSLPAVRPLRTYPVKVEGDDVLLSLDGRPGQGMPHKA